MPQEFHTESFISQKQLNNQSVSLVIPRITRDKIHNSMYYKVNLYPTSLRGETMIQLMKVIVRDLGTLKRKMVNRVHVLGGVQFKCLLMKAIELKPTWDQLLALLDKNQYDLEYFDPKYIIALLLVYVRIQYYYLQKDTNEAIYLKQLFKSSIKDYAKLKSVPFNIDIWSASVGVPDVEILHIDELVDWLCNEEQIWGIQLGKCQWCIVTEESSDEESSDENSDNETSSDEA